MLYTGKGDDGTTTTFGCDQRMSKSSAIAEALGALDETNSFLGLCKVEAEESSKLSSYKVIKCGEEERTMPQILHEAQEQLFIIQAELAGADMTTVESKVRELEAIIESISNELPPIRTFFIAGGTRLAALCDTCRTVARRAERRVVAVAEEGSVTVGAETKAYLNRLSSLLYALARLANHQAGIVEEAPDYK